MYKNLWLLPAVVLVIACSGGPKSKEEFVAAGKQELEAQNAGQAVVYFKKALDRDKNFSEARFQLGRAFLISGKYDSAEKEFQKALLQRPKAPEVRTELARALFLGGKPDRALKVLAGLGSGANEHEVLEISGRSHARKKDYAAAVAELRKALAMQPGSAYALAPDAGSVEDIHGPRNGKVELGLKPAPKSAPDNPSNCLVGESRRFPASANIIAFRDYGFAETGRQ